MTEILLKAIEELEWLNRKLDGIGRVMDENTRRVDAAVYKRMENQEYYDAEHADSERRRIEAEERMRMALDLLDPYYERD